MSWKPAKLGADPKKIAVLAGLLLVAGYFFFSNSDSGGSGTPSGPAAVAPLIHPALRPSGRDAARATTRSLNSNPREFRPTLKIKDLDTSNIDPTLHLNLLARLKKVTADAGTRSLFDIAAAPPELTVKEPAKIEVARKMVGPMPQSKSSEGEGAAADPKAPPIPLKFYGFVNPPKAGIKRAFFLDGEDIIIASEGDLIKKRYKIVRIGVNSAVVEDTQFKSNNEQTLPLVAELAG